MHAPTTSVPLPTRDLHTHLSSESNSFKFAEATIFSSEISLPNPISIREAPMWVDSLQRSECELVSVRSPPKNLKRFLFTVFRSLRRFDQYELGLEQFLGFSERIKIYHVHPAFVLDSSAGVKRQVTKLDCTRIFRLLCSDGEGLSFHEFEMAVGLMSALMNVRLVYMYHLLSFSA